MGHRRDPETVAALGLLGVGAAITVLVHVPRTRAAVQRLDDRWYALVQRSRSAPLTAAAKTLDVGFGTTIDWSVRVAVTAQLVRRRRWGALTAWAATIVLGEVSVGPLKAFVDRIRPPDPRTTTSMMSYPSGHALAAATTSPGIVLALVPPGPTRRRLLAVAIPLAGATALSRTYLNAHWLSDVLGGFALGTGYALAAPRVVDGVIARPGGAGRAGALLGLSGRTTRDPLSDDRRRADHGGERRSPQHGRRDRDSRPPRRGSSATSPTLTSAGHGDRGATMRARSRPSRATPATAHGATAVGAASTGFTAVIAAAAGAGAVGALAIGALAVGRLRIGDAAVKKLRIGQLEVDELSVRRLHVLEQD